MGIRRRAATLKVAMPLLVLVGCSSSPTGDSGKDAGIGSDAHPRADAHRAGDARGNPDASSETDAGHKADGARPKDSGGTTHVDGGGKSDSTTPPTSPAAHFASILGAPHSGHFLVGMGNDGTNGGADPAYSFGVTLDLHYHYLSGLSTGGGWTTWNTNPDYATVRIQQATSHGDIPMFAYYAMAADGQDNFPGSIQSTAYMTAYFADFIELLADVKAAGTPVVILHEPDFWGFTEQTALTNGGAANIEVEVSASGAPECASQPNNLIGFAQCLLKLTRSRAPTALLGFHASSWGTNVDIERNTDPMFDVAGEAAKTVAFFKSFGGDQADFVSTDLIDRDAGCYEVAGTNCGTTPETDVYWDETNATLPNFHQELTWATAITSGLGLPMIWWQLPFGAPSPTAGGTPEHYRDNRVDYIFSHVGEYVAAGGVGAVWGTGDSGQTDWTTDNGEFQTALTTYFNATTPLP